MCGYLDELDTALISYRFFFLLQKKNFSQCSMTSKKSITNTLQMKKRTSLYIWIYSRNMWVLKPRSWPSAKGKLFAVSHNWGDVINRETFVLIKYYFDVAYNLPFHSGRGITLSLLEIWCFISVFDLVLFWVLFYSRNTPSPALPLHKNKMVCLMVFFLIVHITIIIII